ncbi:MAG: sigma-70 family RNA polymerase sigma factor [Planctomycetota bacterium]
MNDEEEPIEGDDQEERLEDLLAQHLPGLRGFLRRRAPHLVLQKESTEDLAQSVCRDVLEHVVDGRMELRSDAEFKQWLYEAALWKLRARRRHLGAQRRDPGREVGRWDRSASGVRPLEPGDSETPSRIVASEEKRDAVRRAIEELGGRDEEVLRLAVLEERPHREIAERLEVTEAHSRVLLSRALARLSKKLEGG